MGVPQNVTRLTRERAFKTSKIVAQAMLNGEPALAYSELARRLEMPNGIRSAFKPILDEAARMCKAKGLPDVTSVIVTKDSLDRGCPFPSLDSFSDGVWPITGMTVDQVPAEQERVRAFDWRAVRELAPGRCRRYSI